MPAPPLDALRVFAVAARRAGFTQAAEELLVSTQAVSQRVRQLEAHLGVALFLRRGPSLRLTEAGRVLAERLEPALSEIAEAVAACQASRPVLNVTSTLTYAARRLTPRLHTFSGAEVRLEAAPDVRSPEVFDVAIRSGTGPWANWHATALPDAPITLLATPRLIDQWRIQTATDALACPRIYDDDWSTWFAAAGVSERPPPAEAGRYDNQELASQAAMRHGGAALLSPKFFQEELADGRLIAPFGDVLIGGPRYSVLTARGDARPEVKAFVAWLRAL